jgi:hypothetical protein
MAYSESIIETTGTLGALSRFGTPFVGASGGGVASSARRHQPDTSKRGATGGWLFNPLGTALVGVVVCGANSRWMPTPPELREDYLGIVFVTGIYYRPGSENLVFCLKFVRTDYLGLPNCAGRLPGFAKSWGTCYLSTPWHHRFAKKGGPKGGEYLRSQKWPLISATYKCHFWPLISPSELSPAGCRLLDTRRAAKRARQGRRRLPPPPPAASACATSTRRLRLCHLRHWGSRCT